MTTSASSQVLATGLGALAFSRRVTEGLLTDIADDKLTFQPVPGANHALWVMGHLAVTDDMFRCAISQLPPTCPESWKPLFGYGSEPTADASDYPPAAEVRRAFDASRKQLCEWFGTMSDEQLARPLPDDFKTFAESHAGLMSTLASHEAMHAGQVTIIRKALGLGRVFG